MNLYDLLQENSALNVTINAGQLCEAIDYSIARTKEAFETKQQPEEYITRKQTAQKLDVNPSSLWRWERENYLVPIRVGGKVRYKLSDVERIMKGGCYDAL